jgi:hypothetical protein
VDLLHTSIHSGWGRSPAAVSTALASLWRERRDLAAACLLSYQVKGRSKETPTECIILKESALPTLIIFITDKAEDGNIMDEADKCIARQVHCT